MFSSLKKKSVVGVQGDYRLIDEGKYDMGDAEWPVVKVVARKNHGGNCR